MDFNYIGETTRFFFMGVVTLSIRLKNVMIIVARMRITFPMDLRSENLQSLKIGMVIIYPKQTQTSGGEVEVEHGMTAGEVGVKERPMMRKVLGEKNDDAECTTNNIIL